MHQNWPIKGTHISVSRSCTHPDYPPGIDGCIRTDTKMIGYLFQPAPDINGCCLTWIYIDDFRGLIPAQLVQKLANLMHKKTFRDIGACMRKYMNNQLDLDDQTQDLIYKMNESQYNTWQKEVVKAFFQSKNLSEK